MVFHCQEWEKEVGRSLPFEGYRGTEGDRGPPTCWEVPKRTAPSKVCCLAKGGEIRS